MTPQTIEDPIRIDDEQVLNGLRVKQNQVTWAERDTLAEKIALRINAEHANVYTGKNTGQFLEELRLRGICPILNLDSSICERVFAYFNSTLCYAAHVPAYSDTAAALPSEIGKRSTYGSYKLEQSLLAPDVIEFALNPSILDLAGAYLNCLPSLYSINTFWTFPSAAVGLTHDFHRDEDDYRFVAVFIYWTPVEQGEGEFYFIDRTHDRRFVDHRVKKSGWARGITEQQRAMQGAEEFRRMGYDSTNGYGFSEFYLRLFPAEVSCVTGRAGTVVVADTFGLHRGSLPKQRARLCTWIRYGLYANDAYNIDKTRPIPASTLRGRVPDNETTKFITRLVLDWNS